MINKRRAALGLALLFGTVLAVPVIADGASDFQGNVTKAQSTLDEMTKLLSSIGQHSTAAVETGDATPTVAVKATLKCPACGMEMASSPSGKNTQKVVMKGKTYYCCTGCNMTQYADKPTTAPRRGRRAAPAPKP